MRLGRVGHGSVWRGLVWLLWREIFIWSGGAGSGGVLRGKVGLGLVRCGEVWSGFSGEKFLSGVVGRGKVRFGGAWSGVVGPGLVRWGAVWSGFYLVRRFYVASFDRLVETA